MPSFLAQLALGSIAGAFGPALNSFAISSTYRRLELQPSPDLSRAWSFTRNQYINPTTRWTLPAAVFSASLAVLMLKYEHQSKQDKIPEKDIIPLAFMNSIASGLSCLVGLLVAPSVSGLMMKRIDSKYLVIGLSALSAEIVAGLTYPTVRLFFNAPS